MSKNNLEVLKEWFSQNLLTLDDIASKTEVTKGYVSFVLNGKRDMTWKFANKLQESYGINPHWLMKNEGEMMDKDFVPKPVVTNVEPQKTDGLVEKILTQNEMLIKQNAQLIEQQNKLIHIIETYASNK